MRRSMVSAGVILAVTVGMVGTPSPAATSQPSSTPTPLSLAVSAADRAAASGLDALAKGPFEQYDRHMVTPWVDGLYSVAYERTYRGLPVVGGDAVVLADGQGKVRSVQSATSAHISVPTTPKISAADAEKTSRAKLAQVDKVDSHRLVVHVKDNSARLGWETVLTGSSATAPSHLHVFVDARSGEVIDQTDDVEAGTGASKWNGPNPLTITTTNSGGSYSLKDPTRPGLQCSDYSTGTVFSKSSDSWGTGNPTSRETGCVDAMWAAQKEWDMLKNWLGRNGHDGNGGSWPVKVGLNDVNAYWDGSSVSIGHNNANEWIASMDVVGHEFGHGIDQFTPGGTSGEAGLGEGTGDIFGALTEAYANEPAPYDTPGDYLVGEMVNLVGTGPIRNMYNPSQVSNNPNCYSSSIPGTEVHAAAGPINHWFYLLAEGSNPGNGKPTSPTCDSSSVAGVGIQNAGKIFYGGMLLKTSSFTYKKYRTATLTSAKNLDSTCGLFAKTKAAWDAISVPAQPADPTCGGTPASDFSLALSPSSGSANPGASVTTTVNTATTSGTAQTVNLTATGIPAGVTVSFSPTSVTSGSNSTMTVAAASNAAAGTYTITVTGAGSASHTAQYTLTVGGGNPTPGAPDIDVANVQAHLAQLNTIATQNGGTRRSSGNGYLQSVAYIKGKLQAAGYTVTEQPCTSGCASGAGPNLIAEWPQGDANSVYMFGSHLDSVSAGPGINDNGSGSAGLLETALVLAQKNPTMTSRIRFGWWTDEEQGLNGSAFYTSKLTTTDRAKIKAYYNFDMIASPNAGYFINNVTSAASAPMKAYWDSFNLQPEEDVEGRGRSDDYSFQNVGIPTSGYAMGASAVKTSAQAAKWGGTANKAFDSCYHQACDTTSNINATALNRAVDGIAYTVWKLAVSDSPPANDFSLSTNPASGTVDPGASTTTTVSTATTSGNAQTVALSASGAPSGVSVSFNPASVTSGQSSTATVAVAAGTAGGTYTITITGAGAVSHSTTFSLTVTGTSGCTAAQLIVNGGFESGTSPWTTTSGVVDNSAQQPAHSGAYKAWLIGYGSPHTDSAQQTVTVPAGCTNVKLSYWLHIDTNETESTVYDTLKVQANGTTLSTLSNVDAAAGYVQRTVDLGAYVGQQVAVNFTATEDASLQTSFVLDDVTLQVG